METGPTHIKDLVPDPENRRKHNPRNIGMVVDTLQQVGAARSIVIDEDNVILAGNGVTEAAAEAGITRVRVVDADGLELIAVRRSGLTSEQKRALAIADNRTAELAEWNVEQLHADAAAGLNLQPWFSEEEAAELLANGAEPVEGKTDPDAVPEQRATDIQPGDLFQLGKHRLLCGDSTKADDVARVLAGATPFIMVTDPPYGVNYEPDWRNDAFKDGAKRRTGEVANDGQVDWTPAWRLFLGAVAYVWHAGRHASEVQASLELAGFSMRAQIIWNKPRMAISRGHYHWKHEPCWYAYREGSSAKFTDDRSQTTVWDIDLKDDTGQTNHGTQKPVDCMERPIRNHGGKDDAVYEPFSGSGTTMIAAERQQRACYAIELTPAYVQMALDRWEQFTGQKASKVGEVVHA